MLTLERLREVLAYNPQSGLLVWKVANSRRVSVGDIAGSLDNNGYIVIRIDRRIYKAHRLAWFLVMGDWPKVTIDHINGVPADNRWSNLREATYSQNNASRGLTSRNKSGLKGVSWDKGAGRWRAQMSVNGKAMYLGLFDTPEMAQEAYRVAAGIAYGEFFWDK